MSAPPPPPPGDADPAAGGPPPDPHAPAPQPAAPAPMPSPAGVPQMATAPAKAGGKGKLIGMILGAVILVGGLGFAGWKWGWPLLQKYLNGGGLDTPHGTVEYVMHGIGDGRSEVLWDVLPETNRTAIINQIKQFGANNDPEVHQKGIEVLKKLTGVLESKKALLIEATGSIPGGGIPKEATENYDGVVEVLKIVANSKLSDPAWLQNPDVEALFKDDFNKILNSATLESMIDKDIQKNVAGGLKDYNPASFSEFKSDLKEIKATTTTESETEATVEISLKKGDVLHTDTVEMKKVGDRWLPVDVADGLEKMMQDLAQSVPGGQLTQSKMTPQQKQVAMNLLNALDNVLTQMEGAQSAQQLQGQLMGAVFSVGGQLAAVEQAFATAGGGPGGGLRPPLGGGTTGFPPTGLPGKGKGKGKGKAGGGNQQMTQAQRMTWTFGGQQRNLQAWKGQSAANVIGLFGQPNPANARAVPGGGEWTFTNLKITDAQGNPHTAITFVVLNGVVSDVRLAAPGAGNPGATPGGGIDPVTGLPLPAPQN